MLNLINTVARRFAKDEDGAVTVDFVVLCGAVVGIGLAAANAIYQTTTDAAAKIKIDPVAATGTTAGG